MIASKNYTGALDKLNDLKKNLNAAKLNDPPKMVHRSTGSTQMAYMKVFCNVGGGVVHAYGFAGARLVYAKSFGLKLGKAIFRISGAVKKEIAIAAYRFNVVDTQRS